MESIGTYIDIAIVAIFCIAFIVGVAKGFLKQLSGFLCGFIAFVGAVALTVVIMQPLSQTEFFLDFATTASGWFQGEYFSEEIHSLEDLNTVLSTAGGWRILAFMSETIFTDMAELGITTLGGFLGSVAASLIAGFVIWLVLYIALKFLFKGIKALLLKISHLPVIKSIDKIFGALWSVVATYIILIVFCLTSAEVVVLKFLTTEEDASIWETITTYIQSSQILTFLHNSNVIGSIIAEYFQITLPTLEHGVPEVEALVPAIPAILH